MEQKKLISLLKFYYKEGIEIEIGVNLRNGLLIKGNIIKLRWRIWKYLILRDKNDSLIKVFIEDIVPGTLIPISFIQDSDKNKKNKKNREGISPKLRFEVLKRDKYVCQYCGACGPDVELEVDHIIPVSKGGTDDLSNLKTACWNCNRGKGDSLK